MMWKRPREPQSLNQPTVWAGKPTQAAFLSLADFLYSYDSEERWKEHIKLNSSQYPFLYEGHYSANLFCEIFLAIAGGKVKGV